MKMNDDHISINVLLSRAANLQVDTERWAKHATLEEHEARMLKLAISALETAKRRLADLNSSIYRDIDYGKHERPVP